MRKKHIVYDTANSKLRVCHVSDNHSCWYKLYGKFSCIIHSGDFFPNSNDSSFIKNREAAFQLEWLNNNIENMRQWTQGLPFFFILGNHDFISPELVEQTLRSNSIDATSISEKVGSYYGFNFYGFPYIPAIDGRWSYEKDIPEMEVEVNKLIKVLNKEKIDILVTHSPLYGVLDRNDGGFNIGNTILTNAILYKAKNIPKYILTGHNHSRGVAIKNNILISNAATSFNIIEAYK